jgi:hypothetical protein
MKLVRYGRPGAEKPPKGLGDPVGHRHGGE